MFYDENSKAMYPVTMGEIKLTDNSIVVESATYGLCSTKHIIDKITCQVSEDQTKLIVFLDNFEASKFYRSTLINLGQSAEMISPACQELVLIVRRKSESYRDFKEMFSVIGVERLTKSKI